MFEFRIIFIFVNFLQVIYAPYRTTLYNLSVTETEAENALLEIQPNQALPLVLFRETEPTATSQPMFEILQIPKDLVQAVIIDGRMVKGTQFMNLSDTQMFFCPKPNSNSAAKCLAPQEFNEIQPLECVQEPIPVVKSKSEDDNCGSEETAIFHNIVYDICPLEQTYEYEYETKEIPFYGFCYDTTKKNTVYTSHVIASPYLLKSNLLLRERRVEYSITIDDKFKPSNLREIEIAEIPEWSLFVHPTKPAYKLQMLVPDADMAFALWRKTTYRNFNLDWQHEKLIPLWNQINDDLRSFASQMFGQNIKIKVRTGVIKNINPAPESNFQMFNIWVKIITTVPSNRVKTPRGIAILMNNFIGTPKKSDDSSATSNPAEEEMKNFCRDDYCAYTLRNKFNQVGGSIRCCSLIKANIMVLNVFGAIRDLDVDGEFHKLQIPGVTNKLAKLPY